MFNNVFTLLGEHSLATENEFIYTLNTFIGRTSLFDTPALLARTLSLVNFNLDLGMMLFVLFLVALRGVTYFDYGPLQWKALRTRLVLVATYK